MHRRATLAAALATPLIRRVEGQPAPTRPVHCPAARLHGRREGAIPAAPVAELDAWLAEAWASGIGAIATFAVGPEVDGAALRAA